MKKMTFVVPPEIRRMLGPAPVLSTEDPMCFEEILKHFGRRIRPRPDDALAWFRVWRLAVGCWKDQRLTGWEIQALEAARRKKIEEEELARAKRAEEERNAREVARRFAIKEGRRPARSADGLVLLSGPPLREAKQRLLSGLLQRPDMCPRVERNGIRRDHFLDDPNWQEAFDLVHSGADIQALIVQNPTSEIARLWQLAEEMRGYEMLALARQIVASVRAEDAPAMVTETILSSSKPDEADDGPKPRTEVTDEFSTEFDYASVLPECLPLLLEIDRLRTSEQKRFDSIPGLIAFERECLALKLDDQPGDVVEGEFKEVPGAEGDKLQAALPSSAPVQPAIGSAAKPPSSAIEAAMSAAISATMVAPTAAPAKSPCVESALPDTQHSSEAVERADGQLQSMDQTAASERSTAMRPLPMLPAVLNSSAAENKALAVEDTLVVPPQLEAARGPQPPTDLSQA
jgi:hypothetical protein